MRQSGGGTGAHEGRGVGGTGKERASPALLVLPEGRTWTKVGFGSPGLLFS